MNNPLLTAKNPFNDGGFNKMPNLQADFLPNEINDLQHGKFSRFGFLTLSEKYFYVHKYGGRQLCDSARGKPLTKVCPRNRVALEVRIALYDSPRD